MKKNPVGWFEIPVTDMERAVRFYEAVFPVKFKRLNFGSLEMALFPDAETDTGSPGSLIRNEKFYKPSTEGVLIYFTTPTGDLSGDLKRAEEAGGKILIPKREISAEFGFMGVILDTEGNRVAIHSRI